MTRDTEMGHVVLAACFALIQACATTSTEAGGTRYCGGAGDEAAKQFEKGMDAFHDETYQEAIKHFIRVQERFQFSECAPLSELLIADCYYEGGQYAEAIDAYEMFVKLHPTHKLVRYALYRKAQAYYEQIPAEFWVLLPPSYERDMSPVKKTLASVREFLERFGAPESGHSGRFFKTVLALREKCIRKMAEHEMYVVRYYWDRKMWRAVVWRLERLLRKYSGSGYEEEALFKLGCCHARLGENAPARQRLEQLLKGFPATSHRPEAERLLKNL